MNMLRFKFFSLCLIGLFFSVNTCFAQEEIVSPQTLEKNILKINLKPLSASTDAERIKASLDIQDQLLEGLLNPISFNYPFDSLKYSTIAIASQKDADCRIFTYNAILLNGKFMHFGVIQRKIKKQIRTFLLIDTLETIAKDAEDETYTLAKWPGALYYQMQPYKFEGKNLILLFGFDGHNSQSNRSFLDVLYFEDGEPLFGYPLFRDGAEDPSASNRLVFEYHKSAQMVLRYQPEDKVIVLDHLGPAYEKVRGNKAYYIPTGDYDGYPLNGKTLVKKIMTSMNFGQDPKPLDPKLLPLPEDLTPPPAEDEANDADKKSKNVKDSKKPISKPSKTEEKKPTPDPKSKEKKKSKSDEDDDDDDDDDKDDD